MPDICVLQGKISLHGVVLAGGKSTRMGRDKAKLTFQGQDLVARAVNVLTSCCTSVWISGRDAADHGLPNPWFMDQAPGKGPLRGILTALKHIQHPCMFLPCDIPLMTPEVINRLVQIYEHRPTGTLRVDFKQQETGFIEALVAIYDPGCIPYIEQALAQQQFKVARAVPENRCIHVPYSIATDSRPFLNINYPEDLALLKKAGNDTFCLLPSPKKSRFSHK